MLRAGDDYTSLSKPQVDWDDPAARADLIDSRAKDGFACLAVLDGLELEGGVAEAGELLATVLGQDLEASDDGTFRIARRVAKDRVISTVDPETRHGHKTSARGFDGYKGHAAVDPDSEIITDTTVSAGNVGDAAMAEELIDDLLDGNTVDDEAETDGDDEAETDGDDEAETDGDDFGGEPGGEAPGETVTDGAASEEEVTDGVATGRPLRTRCAGDRRKPRRAGRRNAAAQATRRAEARAANRRARRDRRRAESAKSSGTVGASVYGDAAYGSGGFLDRLARAGIVSRCKTQPPVAPGGCFAKDRFEINLDDDTVTCPNNVTVTIFRGRHGEGTARFAGACADCPLRSQCTDAEAGRTISVGVHEQRLATPEPTRQTRPGSRTIGRLGPRSNASSGT